MRPAKDYAELRARYQDKTTDRVIATGDTTVAALIAGRANYTLFIQKIVIDVTTDAAQSLILRDTNGTPKTIFSLPASPGTGPFGRDFGAEGMPLTEGKDLSAVLSAAGLGMNIHIEAYLKPTAASMLPSDI